MADDKTETEQCPRCEGVGSFNDLPCPYCDRAGVVPMGQAKWIARRMVGSVAADATQRTIDMYKRRG
jgi:hypothetical protein